MWEPLALTAGDRIIPFREVKEIDISSLEREEVTIITQSGERFVARGFDAIDAVWAFKPSAFEGRRMKWKKGAWAFHNLVAHPLMQMLAWVRLYRLAIKLHDVTTPMPRGFKDAV